VEVAAVHGEHTHQRPRTPPLRELRVHLRPARKRRSGAIHEGVSLVVLYRAFCVDPPGVLPNLDGAPLPGARALSVHARLSVGAPRPQDDSGQCVRDLGLVSDEVAGSGDLIWGDSQIGSHCARQTRTRSMPEVCELAGRDHRN
jgi:hypothetical protein